jgi:hypothetical protein
MAPLAAFAPFDPLAPLDPLDPLAAPPAPPLAFVVVTVVVIASAAPPAATSSAPLLTVRAAGGAQLPSATTIAAHSPTIARPRRGVRLVIPLRQRERPRGSAQSSERGNVWTLGFPDSLGAGGPTLSARR